MDAVQLIWNEAPKGFFEAEENGKRLGQMEIALSGKRLTVYHTEVSPEAEGKGLAKKMLEAMVAYAREQQLNVIPLCPYVHAQFKKNPMPMSTSGRRLEQTRYNGKKGKQETK